MSIALSELTATLIEAAAFGLALGYVLLSIRQVIWGWPLMIVSSVLYGVLFGASRLYGQAALQGVFVAIGLWGWWQWRRGRKGDAPLQVTPLAARTRWLLVLCWAGFSVASALALARLTDAAAPWLDAFTTLGSLVGQVLTARKYVEAWPVWIVVNLVSVALFLQQQLWLTALLYGVFVGLSVIGWNQWRRAARVASG
jgi:nicotinamide mononucleotide transporter